ncbi:Uracil-DNA glycosylase superfamily [Novosphingobium aromaticivorans DSM 12444]|uniref:Type-4 uracil-DNA glycosylase n=1 Tax=Novosphingobium aromaticivorans (strain ATCC 700278 / DSM 12444 / CCUG 56034 / CIP 105152 / NBRC 16084 / F199) TaxID=279238 RepID=Q2G6P5_NOVAD|nr:UdgX family uracil-DNA binding protein [Novosphingobium aromaticivorans]ABD26478.1 Uracil-DNA glycosylase superfamily [Novosphingobium aromaticivorans DSM 12444]SCY77195.1 DNA polymerase [Novosphingobium aromaticivorans]
MMPDRRRFEAFRVQFAASDDFEGWRDAARRMIRAKIAPDQVMWESPADQSADIFARGGVALPSPPTDAPQPRASKDFLQLAQSVILHSGSKRFSTLYRTLWRLQSRPRLMDDKADADVRAMEDLARQVRRDIHKMRAFVRFRSVEGEAGERYVAWFEPEHHILRANAGFFVRRFTTMQWSILTPRGSLHWDGETLHEGPPATRADAPSGDPVEGLWRTYYASIFNPARLKVGAMLKEMPRKYWKNMPEAALIPELIAGAQSREARMVQAGEQDLGETPVSIDAIGAAILACRRCDIGCNGTRAVMGEGPHDAALMIIGEQPGEQEEAQGRPFVGPAGQLLRTHLEHAGIPAERAYVTNAVKHFKFMPQGKRRLHQNPSAREIDVCRWWLEGERGLVRPRLILALGASAARSLLGRTVSVQKVRGAPHVLDDGSELWITTHPSYLLRLDDGGRSEEEARFSNDLQKVAARLSQISSG